jgi:hypothetical protein
LEDGGVIRAEHLYAALTREYRKIGATCPLRPTGTPIRPLTARP